MPTCLSLFLALSMHIGLSQEYNQVHPHARCTVDDYITGVFYNSEDNVSAYIGKKYYPVDRIWTLEYGLITGYKSSKVLPMMRYKSGNWFVAPAYEVDGNFGITLGWEYEFK